MLRELLEDPKTNTRGCAYKQGDIGPLHARKAVVRTDHRLKINHGRGCRRNASFCSCDKGRNEIVKWITARSELSQDSGLGTHLNHRLYIGACSNFQVSLVACRSCSQLRRCLIPTAHKHLASCRHTRPNRGVELYLASPCEHYSPQLLAKVNIMSLCPCSAAACTAARVGLSVVVGY